MNIFTQAGKVNANLNKYALNHGLELTVSEGDSEDPTLLCIWEAEEDSEWMCSYQIDANGLLSWHGNVYLAQAVKEELPATIDNAKKLKEVIKFLGENK